jgi:NADH-quinone oxidoreductase subunit J
VLTHRDRSGVRRQKIGDQIARNRHSVELKKVESGKGI